MRKFLVLQLPFWLFVISISGSFFSSCETEKEVIRTVTETITDTITVEIVSVDSIFTEPDSITEGATVTLVASVELLESIDDLNYEWFATDGTFETSSGDTAVWKAPDLPGSYLISVHVTDGKYIGIGSRFVGVGMYVPSITPFYMGDISCISCHSEKHLEWAETGHADAWNTLQSSGGAQSFCNPCHAVGFEGEFGNGGYDETPIQAFENVQCENCHGAASDHIANLDPTMVSIDFTAQQCGTCHDGTHHPFLGEWEESAHAFDPEAAFAASIGSCQGCHEGVAASIRLSGDLSVYYGSGTIDDRPSTDEVPLTAVTCATCHDPHSHDNPGQLRTVADVPLVEANGDNPVITIGGSGKLCMHCHHARRGPEFQIEEGYDHFGPHANPQADMMQGASAYHGVASDDFVWADPSHLAVQNSCKTCHLNTVEYVSNDEPAKTGHTFEPTVAACANCHGAISDFDDVRALEDFDTDGTVEGIQSEVRGLMDILETELVASFTTRGQDTVDLGLDGVLGDTSLSTFVEREAGYNWFFVHDDKSDGIHNPDYTVQLLQQSILHLTGDASMPSMIVSHEQKTVGNW